MKIFTFTNRRCEVLGRTTREMTRAEVEELLARFGIRAEVRKNGVFLRMRDSGRVSELPFVAAAA